MQIVRDFEVKFEKVNFKHGEINFYPLIKIQYSYQLHLLLIKGFPKSLGNTDKASYQLPFLRKIFYKLNLLRLNFWRKNIKKTNNQILIIEFKEHATDKLLSFGKLVNPFTVPFQQLFEKAGINFDSIALEDVRKESLTKKAFENYDLIRKLTADELAQNNGLLKSVLAIEKFSKENGFDLPGLGDFLFKNIIENQAYYKCFKCFLESVTYKKILTYCYYNNQILALNRAARDLCITTVEYQHSIQSDDHFAYSNWKYNIDYAANHFPEVFWVWRESDKLRIDKTFNFPLNSSAILGGNVYLSALSQRFEVVNKKALNGIVVALQGAWIPEFIEKSVANNSQFTWYFRLHPRYPDDRPLLEKFKEMYPDRVEIEQANNLSLYELLAKVKFNITAFSGTALEAQAFGAQTIIFGEDGHIAYRDYIENDAFYFVDTTEKLDEILNRTDRVFKTYDTMLTDEAQIEKNILNVFSDGVNN